MSMVVMLGMLGLTFDLGRMFIAKNELQTYVDAAALAAAKQLDGLKTGVDNAHTISQFGPNGSSASTTNRMTFSTIAVNQVSVDPETQIATASRVTDSYSPTFGGPYDSYGTGQTNAANNTLRFVNVTASVQLPMTLMRVVPGVPSNQTITATAIGGQGVIPGNAITSGVAPFGPLSQNTKDTKNFGFAVNTEYTLKWGNGNTTNCGGDKGFSAGNAPDQHGFLDLGQGNANSALRDAIMNGVVPPPISVGQTTLGVVPGNRGSSIFTEAAGRSAQDPDQSSVTIAEYQRSLLAGTANGRRILTVLVMDPNSFTGNGSNRNGVVIGFANFLLDPAATISGNSGPFCGAYMGPGSLSGVSSGGSSGTVLYGLQLFK
jgi:Flp pilus assembly protein TadG